MRQLHMQARELCFKHICDPTQVNEANVVKGPNCEFAVNVFCRNQESF